MPEESPGVFLCENCKSKTQLQVKEGDKSTNLQLVPIGDSESADKSQIHVPKLLKDRFENHPEVLRKNIELKQVKDKLEHYRNFYDLGEREVLLEDIQDLRSQLQHYVDSLSPSSLQRNSLLKLTYSCDPSSVPFLCTIPESTEESAEEKLEQERMRWTDAESKWISLSEELRTELDSSRALAQKLKLEVETEKKSAEELKEAMQMAMEGHARMLEQHADLEEKHIQLLARHRKIQEGIDDVKKVASKAGVKGADTKFINALAAEISALKAEREKEWRYFREENKGLQAQLKDTAEAVQAAGELLVRLKEAVAVAEKRAMVAEQEAGKAYKQIDKLKRTHASEISDLNDHEMVNYDVEEPINEGDQRGREGLEPFYNGDIGDLSKLAEPSSWFSGYDRCNI